MRKIIIFGNSASGKSSLAKRLADSGKLSHLDLDSLAWQPLTPPQRTPLHESNLQIEQFMRAHEGWVIEGCYTDLLQVTLKQCPQMIFLNVPLETCLDNARRRPWEVHKYASKAAQDANLPMLLNWIAEYSVRYDTFSLAAHSELYERYSGEKIMLNSNEDVLQYSVGA